MRLNKKYLTTYAWINSVLFLSGFLLGGTAEALSPFSTSAIILHVIASSIDDES